MTSALTIWLPDDLSAPWAWTHGSESGWAATATERSGLAGRTSDGLDVICPGQWVRVFEHDLPNMRQSERVKAGGYGVEDHLAAAVTDQHIALASGDDKRLAVISRARMDLVQAALADHGLLAKRVGADFDVVEGEGPWRVMGRDIYPGRLGYSLDHSDEAPDTGWPGLDWTHTINLLQGDYQATSRFPLDRTRLTRFAALFLGGCVAWLLWHGAQIRGLQAQTDSIRAEMTEMYQTATGEAAPANLVAVVNRARRSGAGGQAGFSDLAQGLFAGLSQNSNVLIDTMRYDRGRDEIILRLIYPQFESAGQLEAAFGNLGYEFRSGAVREQGDQLIGEAVLAKGGGS